jgi:hypothetical protein
MGSSSCWVIAGILFPLQDDEVEAVEGASTPTSCRRGNMASERSCSQIQKALAHSR